MPLHPLLHLLQQAIAHSQDISNNSQGRINRRTRTKETPINQTVKQPKKVGRTAQEYSLGRLEQPSDVAAMIAFFASANADYLTGSTFFVDGGLTWNYQEQ